MYKGIAGRAAVVTGFGAKIEEDVMHRADRLQEGVINIFDDAK